MKRPFRYIALPSEVLAPAAAEAVGLWDERSLLVPSS
jgi:hypothetical protein